jgi:isochorismate synthase
MLTESSRSTVPRLNSVTRPTPMFDPIAAFMAATGEPVRTMWLRPATGEALVGIGAATTLCGDISRAWRELTADDASQTPVLMGAFGFDPLAPTSGLWGDLGRTRFVLPKRVLRMQGASAWLTTNAVEAPRPLLRPSVTQAQTRTGLAPAEWRSLVREVARGIRDGQLGVRKVVLARTQQVHVNVSIETVLRRLATAYPGCTVFAFEVDGACFLGATPERLIALQDGTATTMALAGSGPRGATPEADALLAHQLLQDPKERTEHAVVVDALREDLAPVATRVIADAEPRVHALANVQHLLTPIRAQVKDGCSVLDLVARLHPTPAVGGYPRERARQVIREREALDRGWYAAPFGWVDSSGHGEFVVGLRSALVRDGTATLFAGCGIVGDSDSDTEFVESGWKLRPMRVALGVET